MWGIIPSDTKIQADSKIRIKSQMQMNAVSTTFEPMKNCKWQAIDHEATVDWSHKGTKMLWSFKKIAESYQGWLVCSESAMCLHLFQPCSLVAVASSPWCESTCKKKYWWKKKRNVLLCMITTASSKYDHDDFFLSSPLSLSLPFPFPLLCLFLLLLCFSFLSLFLSCFLSFLLSSPLGPSGFSLTIVHIHEQTPRRAKLILFPKLRNDKKTKSQAAHRPAPPQQPSSPFVFLLAVRIAAERIGGFLFLW